MAEKKSPMAFRLKKTVTKLTAFIRLCFARRRSSRRLRVRSFGSDDRTPAGLRSFLEDDRATTVENCSVRRLDRTSSSSRYGRFEDDVDKRSEIFIDNFRSQLRLERQISLQLRYYRINSSETEYEEIRSPPWKFVMN